MTIYEDELDLRPYILAIIKYWKFILLMAIIAGLATLIFSLVRQREYQATATVLLTRSRATLSLADQFPTINEPVDARARMDSLVSIANSDGIAAQTLNAVDGSLASQFEDYSELKEKVEISSEGDLILISATAQTPELAVEISNKWARQTVSTINFAYSGEQPLAEIQDQLESASQEYQVAQSELENFIRDNQIEFLNSQITEVRTLYTSLAEYRTKQIDYFYKRKLSMEDLVVQAETLKEQLQSGNRSAAGNVGDALAVLKTRSTALGVVDQKPQINMVSDLAIDESGIIINDSGFSINLQISDVSTILDTPREYVADLDNFIKLAIEEQAEVENILKDLAEEVSQVEGYDEIKRIAEQLRSLESQLEVETARQTELTSQRDLAWQAYQVIALKEAELRNALQEASLVTIASLAVPPQEPVSRGTVQNTLISATLGAFIGVVFVLAMTWWRDFNRPNFIETSSEGEIPVK